MEGTFSGVGVHSLLDELGELDLISGDGSGDNHGFASYNDDLLAEKKLFGHNGGKTTEKVSFCVDYGNVTHIDRLQSEEMKKELEGEVSNVQ